MSEQGGTKFFVRSSVDGPVKGPFDRDALRKSLDRGLMKPDAQARAESSDADEWVTLESLFKTEDDDKELRAERRELERAQDLQRMHRAHEQKAGGANMVVGAIMLVAGLILTIASMSAGRGGGMIFIGLIAFGIIRLIRGAASR